MLNGQSVLLGYLSEYFAQLGTTIDMSERANSTDCYSTTQSVSISTRDAYLFAMGMPIKLPDLCACMADYTV